MILNVSFDMFYTCILASNILKQRQKVIRIADESEMGWKIVDEYIQSEVASDEEDQKRIHRAQSRAARKAKSDRGRRARQYFPYGRSFGGRRPVVAPTATITQPIPTQQQQQPQQRRSGTCFSCGEISHWKFECPGLKKNLKLSIANTEYERHVNVSQKMISGNTRTQISLQKGYVSSQGDTARNDAIACHKSGNATSELSASQNISKSDSALISPFKRLKQCKQKWQEAGADTYIMSVIEEGYKIPFKELPERVKAKNNRSARDNPEFV